MVVLAVAATDVAAVVQVVACAMAANKSMSDTATNPYVALYETSSPESAITPDMRWVTDPGVQEGGVQTVVVQDEKLGLLLPPVKNSRHLVQRQESRVILLRCLANFYSLENGGWTKPIQGESIHCPCRVGPKYYECAIVNQEKNIFLAGGSYRLSLEFLLPDLVREQVVLGQEIYLCVANQDIASLVVERIEPRA